MSLNNYKLSYLKINDNLKEAKSSINGNTQNQGGLPIN